MCMVSWGENIQVIGGLKKHKMAKWFTNYTEAYSKIISPWNEKSNEAMKSSIELLVFVKRVINSNGKRKEYIVG